MNKTIIILNGPMCSRKSTITKLIMQNDDFFWGSFDTVKWLISNYSRNNEGYKKIAKEIIFNAVTIAAESGFSIIIDGGFSDYKEKYQELAKTFNLRYLNVNIEAPIEILEKRFIERLARSKTENKKTSVSTLEDFHSRYQRYLSANKDPEAVTFDSAKMTTEEIAANILEIVAT